MVAKVRESYWKRFNGYGRGDAYVPLCSMKLAKRGLFYTPTFTSSKSASKWLCEEEMRHVKHKEIWDAGEKDMCINAVCNDKALVNRVTQKLVDSVQTRKRATRNKFMSLLGYTMLNVQRVPYCNQPKRMNIIRNVQSL